MDDKKNAKKPLKKKLLGKNVHPIKYEEGCSTDYDFEVLCQKDKNLISPTKKAGN